MASFTIIAPALQGGEFNEATELGSAVWLWMHSASHRNTPLHGLSSLLLPAIKRGQFVLVSEGNKPVFYLSWARMSLDAESRYLRQHPLLMPAEDWTSGDRIWLLDWVAPFGHSRAMRHIIARLFSRHCMRALYHRSNERGLRIKQFHGISIMPAEARAWFALHPVALPDGSSAAAGSLPFQE
ncbi:toxin-activating lysine-acyltransferase [Aquitalea sp. FJL05]|uniref:toxin-activating lysine-acyltransferase n=1 Tax=Aquitalea sp. FJL05 TaxID=2153366 RepID=UPI000F593488|nr:toxin-activating lysine-acyltransferase [Aquitalea sp. FJL05]RQO73162.1 toxin-activating lysine-acyltransferase [Aquitalea sp. FJL05]